MSSKREKMVGYMGQGETYVTDCHGMRMGEVIHKGSRVKQGGFTSMWRRYVRVELTDGSRWGGWSQGATVYIKLTKLGK